MCYTVKRIAEVLTVKERKYLDRYRVTAPNKAEYAGEYYAFPEGVAEARRRGLRLAAWQAGWWALIVVHPEKTAFAAI